MPSLDMRFRIDKSKEEDIVKILPALKFEEMDLYKDIVNKKFVFIPHGVVKDDVRIYLNRELIMPDLITTSYPLFNNSQQVWLPI